MSTRNNKFSVRRDDKDTLITTLELFYHHFKFRVHHHFFMKSLNFLLLHVSRSEPNGFPWVRSNDNHWKVVSGQVLRSVIVIFSFTFHNCGERELRVLHHFLESETLSFLFKICLSIGQFLIHVLGLDSFLPSGLDMN